MKTHQLLIACALFVTGCASAQEVYKYTNYASTENSDSIVINVSGSGYSTGNEIFDLGTCNDADAYNCYFTQMHAFAIPKNIPQKSGQQWKFREYDFIYLGDSQLRIFGSDSKVMRIQAKKKGRIIATFLFSRANGLLGIIETVSAGNVSFSELYVSENYQGFSAKK